MFPESSAPASESSLNSVEPEVADFKGRESARSGQFEPESKDRPQRAARSARDTAEPRGAPGDSLLEALILIARAHGHTLTRDGAL
ncbi:MAG: hypothetical protein RIS35_1637, partial [Pseudomonadota bacterium]